MKNMMHSTLETIIMDETLIGKVSTFDVFIASLPSPLNSMLGKTEWFLSGKLLCYLPTLNSGEGGYIREVETISFEL